MADRDVLIRRLRRGAFAVLALASMAIAVFLIWIALAPGTVGLTPTPTLLGILSMLCLPGLTVAAWHWDRSNRRRLAVRAPEEPEPALPRRHAAGRSRPHTGLPPDDTPVETSDETSDETPDGPIGESAGEPHPAPRPAAARK